MSRPSTKGFQKPIDNGKRKPVGIAVITYANVEGRTIAACSCGAPFIQKREKPREDAIDKHIAKKHSGRGIRL